MTILRMSFWLQLVSQDGRLFYCQRMLCITINKHTSVVVVVENKKKTTTEQPNLVTSSGHPIKSKLNKFEWLVT